MQRRDFLKAMGLSAGALAVGGVHPAHATGRVALPARRQTDWEEMNLHHQEKVQIFLDRIGQDPEFWLPPMEPTMDGDVKVFEITCSEIEWSTEEGLSYSALVYNGRVPGPTIRVNEGDRCRFVVTNEIPDQSTAIHWHGLYVPADQDGVPYISQPPIDPGQTYTYEFTVRNGGSHMYHSHHNAAEQVTRGLLGAFIVDPADTAREPEVSADYVFVLNDSALGFTINGKSFPYTQPIVARLGDRIRIRYMNEGLMIHPMHLHGMPMTVFSKDGWYLPVPYQCDTLNIAPGERYDVIVDCTEPGAWAFHCHILTHAEGPNGMFGMVTALVVQE